MQMYSTVYRSSHGSTILGVLSVPIGPRSQGSYTGPQSAANMIGKGLMMGAQDKDEKDL